MENNNDKQITHDIWVDTVLKILNVECNIDNWDGYGANKADSNSCKNILNYLQIIKQENLSKYITDISLDTLGCFIMDIEKNNHLISIAFRTDYVNYFTETLGNNVNDNFKAYCSDNLLIKDENTRKTIIEEIQNL